METQQRSAERWVSLDQFRGYTVLGMFFVNFVGGYAAIPAVFKHHNTYCSYADTIMPQFFLAVGVAYRLSFLRRRERGGPRAAYGHAIARCLGLILLGIVVYHLDGGVKSWSQLQDVTLWEFLGAWKRSVFQTLVHIGVTALWILPVLASAGWVRVAFATASGLLHFVLSSGFLGWSNYVWVNSDPRGIDGGPLGFLTWTIPMIAGTLAYDWTIARMGPWRLTSRLVVVGSMLMLGGYLLEWVVVLPQSPPGSAGTAQMGEVKATPPPFMHRIPDPHHVLTMSQRSGSITYLTFATGFSLALYGLFVVVCDVWGWQLGILRTLGTNPLAGYLIHDVVNEAIKPWAPKDSPLWFVLAAFGLSLFVCYVFLRFLEKRGLFLRL